MADDIIPGTPSDPRPAGRSPLTCEFCGSRLTAGGDVMALSARAKELRDAADEVSDLRDDNAALTARIVDLEAQIAVLTKPREPAEPERRSAVRW